MNSINEELKKQVKSGLEPLVKHPLTEEEIFQAVFNLRGFAQTLIKMKMELDKNER